MGNNTRTTSTVLQLFLVFATVFCWPLWLFIVRIFDCSSNFFDGLGKITVVKVGWVRQFVGYTAIETRLSRVARVSSGARSPASKNERHSVWRTVNGLILTTLSDNKNNYDIRLGVTSEAQIFIFRTVELHLELQLEFEFCDLTCQE